MNPESAEKVYEAYVKLVDPGNANRKKIQEIIAAEQFKTYKNKAFAIKIDKDGMASVEIVDGA